MGLPLSVISQVLCRINVFSSFALGEQWNHPSTSPGLLAFISNLGAGGGWRAAPQPWTSSRHTILLDTEDAEVGLHLVRQIICNANSCLGGR